jgi:dihydroflavonol-4-reductase
MRLLITGATGFAGNALLDALPADLPLSRLTLLALPGDPGTPRVLAKRIRGLEILAGDVRDARAVETAVEGHTHVIHMAGFISYWGRDRERLHRVNVEGTRNVVDAALAHGVKRMVHISSVGALGFYPDGRLADETTPFNWPGGFLYMTTKHEGQRVVQEAVRERGLNAVILNPASLMGPGDPDPASPHNNLYGMIERGPSYGCFAGGLAITDVRDLAQVILKALARGAAGETHLVVGSNVTYVEVVRLIGTCLARPVHPFRIPPVFLTAGGGLLELASLVTRRRPLLTAAYGRLSGWRAWYSNAKSMAVFGHPFLPLERTIADGCTFYRETFGRGEPN